MGERPKLPKRSNRFGIGKEIGGAVYVHRNYADVFGEPVASAAKKIPVGFAYDVVKFNLQTGAVSFVRCKDFDLVDEPAVGEIITVSANGDLKRRKPPSNPEIYHHKWLFVADDYCGFDVEESQRRSLEWMAVPEIDRKRIGRLRYWEETVVPRLGCQDT